MSHLTTEEIEALQTSKLPRDTPHLIRDVSHGIFSIARHYGGAMYNGKSYAYVPTTDEMVLARVRTVEDDATGRSGWRAD